MIQWYDFKLANNLYLYRYLYLKITEFYNLIEIEAIENNIYIIPHFEKNNYYLVNRFLF